MVHLRHNRIRPWHFRRGTRPFYDTYWYYPQTTTILTVPPSQEKKTAIPYLFYAMLVSSVLTGIALLMSVSTKEPNVKYAAGFLFLLTLGLGYASYDTQS